MGRDRDGENSFLEIKAIMKDNGKMIWRMAKES